MFTMHTGGELKENSTHMFGTFQRNHTCILLIVYTYSNNRFLLWTSYYAKDIVKERTYECVSHFCCLPGLWAVIWSWGCSSCAGTRGGWAMRRVNALRLAELGHLLLSLLGTCCCRDKLRTTIGQFFRVLNLLFALSNAVFIFHI